MLLFSIVAFITKFTVTVVIVVLRLLFGNKKNIQTVKNLLKQTLYTFLYTF